MPFYSYDAQMLPPGLLPPIEAIEQDLTSIIWDKLYKSTFQSYVTIDGAARDDDGSSQTVLRPGLLMTKNTSTDKWQPWGTETSFTSDKIQGVLMLAQKMTRNGVDQDRFTGYMLVGGLVKVNGLIVHGESSAGIVGHAQETNIRQQMYKNFMFDDDPQGHKAGTITWA